MAKWTPWQIDQVRRHYAKMPVASLATLVSKTIEAVRHKARLLGVRSYRHWPSEHQSRLRELWGKVPARELAREFGRTLGAVKQQAVKLGLDAGRFYTDSEREQIRRLYPTHTAAQIATVIHGTSRTAIAIYRVACKLGIRKLAGLDEELLSSVARLHKQGLSDRAIAKQLGISRDRSKYIRRERLNLRLNPDIDGKREAVRTQFRRLGIRSGGELRRLSYRKYARANGWPEDLRPREVQILNCLARYGMMTRLQLAKVIGMRIDRIGSNGSLNLLVGNGPGGTYTASLQRRGLVVRVGRTWKGTGRGHSRYLYALSEVAIGILEERHAGKSQTV